MPDFRDQHRGAALQRIEYGRHGFLVFVAALAVMGKLALADELHSLWRYFVDLEFARVAEMLIDASAALGGDREQVFFGGGRSRNAREFALARDQFVGAVFLDPCAIGSARVHVV